MTITTFAGLDQAELFQLATSAIAKGESGSAMAYLKEAVARPDATALAHYVLGAEYAEISMFDRATGAMEAALALDPGLDIARFQLGQLWLTIGDNARADLVWAPLAELPLTHHLNRFGAGLQHYVRGEFEQSRRCLLEGLACDGANPVLNADMLQMLEHAQGLAPAAQAGAAIPAAPPASTAPPTEAETEHAANHMFISAYTGNS